MTDLQTPASFRLAYVPGVTPAKWVRVWQERLPDVPLELVEAPAAEAAALVRSGGSDAGLVRTPVDRTDLHLIPLYTETTVVVIGKDHLFASAEELTLSELSGEIVLEPADDVLDWQHRPGRPAIERPASTADAFDWVAASVGLLLVPQSLARLHHRRDLTYRPVPDATQSGVGLVWPEAETSELVEEFIGIVRGRTANSSRGRAATAPEPKPKPTKQTNADSGGAGRKTSGGRRTRGGSGNAKGGRRGRPRRRS